MRLAPIVALTMFAALVNACCEGGTEIVEAIYADAFYADRIQQVQAYEREGYDCSSAPMRNAFGEVIGMRYTCSLCD